MYLQGNYLVFNTKKKIICIDGMYDVSENGVFRTLGYDQVIQAHKLTPKEKEEVIIDLANKIENLKTFH